MPALDSKLRSQLDDVCQKARDHAVAYAQSALQKRGVDAAEALSHFGPKDKELRNRLRARGRQVGDVRNEDKTQSIDQLSQELAYEYWHRMLFARFLAENHLLMHPDGVAVSLEECDELAPEADPPAANGFVLAARYASRMLPQIFRTDDVLLEIEFAPEQRLALEKLLASLPKQTFEADDSLGWVYQFWQTAEKKRVNDSGDKIDGRTLPAVTQLFTEHYMVEFLLQNTIGAWWCAKKGIQGPPGGAGIPAGKSPVEMPYLRWRDDGTPAAGKFEGWPKTLAEFTMLDPCCGSGHFLVAAFNLLVPLRMHDEGLSAAEASEAVLRDNIFGLELDPRCTQIAAFALALAAWKYPDAGGYRLLSTPNIACSGQGVTGKKDEWLALANGNDKLRNGMNRLYDIFQQAPHLGSLIDPSMEKGNLYEAGFAELQPLLAKALATRTGDAELTAVGVAAQGITRAADLLAKRYSLVITNVPYLGRGKQDEPLTEYLGTHYSLGKADLATAFIQRCIAICKRNGSAALVAPQSWFFLVPYKGLRKHLHEDRQFDMIARLGTGAFDTISGEVVNVALSIITVASPFEGHSLSTIDVSEGGDSKEKAHLLASNSTSLLPQKSLCRPPAYSYALGGHTQGSLLSDYASAYLGICTGDSPRFSRFFWEIETVCDGWVPLRGTVDCSTEYDGLSKILYWQDGIGELYRFVGERLGEGSQGTWLRGKNAWGKKGISVTQMSSLPASLYMGELYDDNVAVIIPADESHLPAIAAFCLSDEYPKCVRQINQKLAVKAQFLVNIPFDLSHWQAIAADKYPHALPKPYSADPTQWLFIGDMPNSHDSLQVAVSRLLGYHWPQQSSDGISSLAINDGIACLPGVRGEPAASERLLEVLRAAHGKNWSDSVLHKLLTDAGCKAGTTLDDWLRSQFFEQHSKRFQNRPFIWHIWDGRKDGFSALVNYHKLNYKTLDKLTYAYLGDWITAQTKSDKAGADLRLGAAQALQEKLKLILAGEPPYDIFVRWKPLHEQPMGWNPDLNDGVRMNIRPFIEAGILRKNPNIKWTKDRGKEPQRDKADYPWFWSGKEFVGDRVNDIHLTNAEKQAARSRKKGAK
jgi:hypothetical protein